MIKDSDAIQSHFDAFEKLTTNEVPSLINFGAGVIDIFLTWAAQSGLPQIWAQDKVQVNFVVPVSADPLSIEHGYKALVQMTNMCKDAGVNLTNFVAVNEKDGNVVKLEHDRWWKSLRGLSEAPTEAIFLDFDKCAAELWSQLPGHKLSPVDFIAMSPSMLKAEFVKANQMQCNRSTFQITSWYKLILERMIEAGLLVENVEAESVAPSKGPDVDAKKGAAVKVA